MFPLGPLLEAINQILPKNSPEILPLATLFINKTAGACSYRLGAGHKNERFIVEMGNCYIYIYIYLYIAAAS